MDDLPEPAVRRNIALVIVDSISFLTGATFIGSTTVLPALVRLLGGSPVVVGALSAIQTAGWLLPQLIASRSVLNRPLVKAYVIAPGILCRAVLVLYAPILLLCGRVAPEVALAALLVTLGIFFLCDAFSVVAWFELLTKIVPASRRGRTLGVGQALGSLTGAGAGLVVQVILSRPGPFPRGYALLLLLAAAALSVGLLALACVREPRAVPQGKVLPPWREFGPQLISILRGEPRFAWATVACWLAGLTDAAAAFYVLYATGPIGIPQDAIGVFATAGVVGGFLSGTILGALGDRRGPAEVIRIAMGLRCLPPVLALAAPACAARAPAAVLCLFVAAFAVQGVINGAFLIGFVNYVLGIAPSGSSAVYGALFHTASALILAGPLAAGWLVQVASHEALFVASLALALAGAGLAMRAPQAAKRPCALDGGMAG
ncbi:MAG: hypothetical protein K6V36_10370 [Anaerolineae bacterium]|nr:hypothetical protein [Anaerolineae bacterium]